MDTQGSITHWITQLKARDPEAAEQLWQRYFLRVVALARRRLQGLPPGVEDEEDLALSALYSLVRGAADGRFSRLEDRHDLWQVLVMLTDRKVHRELRHELAQKRDRRRRQSAAAKGDASTVDEPLLEQVPDPQPTPEMIASLNEELRRLLARLEDDQVRQLALLRLEGYRVEEIAERLGRPLRSVERKLRLIRQTWEKETRS